MNKQDVHLAYVLHTRAFRETSLLLDVLCSEYGRISLVARGAKRGKSKLSAILQPFIPLQISWCGSGELVTLTKAETLGLAHVLPSRRAICGLYINELLFKLVNKWDPCVSLFNSYRQTLENLTQQNLSEQAILRSFEKELLRSLGYGLQLTVEIDSGNQVQADQYYKFDPVLGPRLVGVAHIAAIKGASLLALERNDFESPSVLLDIKRLMRLVFSYHLGNKTLLTRELL